MLDFKERKKGKDYILVELVVERDSQKVFPFPFLFVCTSFNTGSA